MQRLRERKRRDRKPFAVLFVIWRGLPGTPMWTMQRVWPYSARLRRLCCSSAARAPRWPATVAPGLGTLGAFLAYTPLHRALIQAVGTSPGRDERQPDGRADAGR